MKRFFATLLALVMLLSLAACGGEDPEEDLPAGGELPAGQKQEPELGFGSMEGNWNSGDLYYQLRINAEGQLWLLAGGTVQVRGWLVPVALTEDDRNGEYGVRYDFYTQENVLMASYYCNAQADLLIEENTQGQQSGLYVHAGPFTQVEQEPDTDEPLDGPNGFLEDRFVDHWYLFGELEFPSLVIREDGTWEALSGMEDGYMAQVLCVGFATPDGGDGLWMADNQGEEFGYASLGDEGLTLVLTEGYEYLLEAYLHGRLVFCRASESADPEDQPLG